MHEGDVSRFAVLYARPRGTVKQRRYREGVLIVSFRVAHLRASDEDGGTCVCSFHSTGLLPNAAYKLMQRAHNGTDWAVAGAEAHIDDYHVQFVEAYVLHLLPYAAHTTTTTTSSSVDTVRQEEQQQRATDTVQRHKRTLHALRKDDADAAVVQPHDDVRASRTTTRCDALSVRLRQSYPHYFA